MQDPSADATINQQANVLFEEHKRSIFVHTDRMFAALMTLQFVGGVAVALWLSPWTWAGAQSWVSNNVWAAIFLGGAITALPVVLALVRPGHTSTRYVIAVAQMIMSALLIHLTGGRIETHFHVFGSLAFLAAYRDWRVLVPATVVVAVDHMLRGIFWPESVYGVLTAQNWRWVEHAFWVLFEDTFLYISIKRSVSEMWDIACRTAEIRHWNDHLEERVAIRTAELEASNANLENEIAARKLAEERLSVFNRKLKQSNSELQDFAYVASHDLQEPLRKVQAFSERLKTKYGEKLEGDGLDYLERMRNAAERMQMLIQDLLTFSRVSTMAQPFSSVELGTVAREVLSDLEVKIEETGANVEVGELPAIEADKTQMRQLLQNLIGNALKFRKPNTAPVINIYAEKTNSNGNGSNGNFHLIVEDNGIGFDEKYVNKIFAVFQRLHGRNEYEGSGVGLAVCRKIVERHHGSIAAKSNPGEGTTFIVTLPKQQVIPNITHD